MGSEVFWWNFCMKCLWPKIVTFRILQKIIPIRSGTVFQCRCQSVIDELFVLVTITNKHIKQFVISCLFIGGDGWSGPRFVNFGTFVIEPSLDFGTETANGTNSGHYEGYRHHHGHCNRDILDHVDIVIKSKGQFPNIRSWP